MHVLPVIHDRLESADQVRLAFLELEPDGVVVEIPSSLSEPWLRGVERLPAISVVVSEYSGRRPAYLVVHPADAAAEAARSALERGLPVMCGDLDVGGYGEHRDRVPDSYTISRLGPVTVQRAFERAPRAQDPADAARERSLAFHARRLVEEGAQRVLLVCGMHHTAAVLGALAQRQATPLSRSRRADTRLVHLHPESLAEVLTDAPFYVATYERRRLRLPSPPPTAKRMAAGRDYGPFRVLSGGGGDDPDRISHALDRCARRAGRHDWTTPHAGTPVDDPQATPGPLDRLRLQWAMLREAEQALEAAAYDEQVSVWQRRNLARFTRNLAAVSGRLTVDLFDLLIAARGCMTDNFAWELHRMAASYPWQTEAAGDLSTMRLGAEDLFDGVRRLRLGRRLPRRKGRGPESLLKRRRDERWAGEWLEGFDGDTVCSYPPEDVIVEEFGRYLRRRGKSILSEEAARSVPFTTSVLDGIDVRETIRHWTEQRIYVRELGRVPGDVGSVVAIFDEDADAGEERFPHRMTWLGEHAQESDMAFYCTEPLQGIVGPGVCRTTYGGFLLSYPPGRLLDVWTDADYRSAESKPEVLLMAALDYARERIVVHLAARPPRSMMYQLAARLDRKILHVPIGTLSPSTIRKIRVMHILSGQDKRAIAPDYIW